MQISEQNGIKFRIKTPVYFDDHVEVGFGLERDIHWAEIDINRCNRNKEVPFREQILNLIQRTYTMFKSCLTNPCCGTNTILKTKYISSSMLP